jgi:hydrogenase nickel incorporation protein HypA/HybF
MHELGIANSILEAVRSELTRYPGERPTKVGVRIGELSAVDEETLRFCFEAITHDTDLHELQLEIEQCPHRQRCSGCGCEFLVRDYDHRCPRCAVTEGQCIGGEELDLAYLEVEHHEPASA